MAKLDRFTTKTIEECKGVLRHSWYTEPQTGTREPGSFKSIIVVSVVVGQQEK